MDRQKRVLPCLKSRGNGRVRSPIVSENKQTGYLSIADGMSDLLLGFMVRETGFRLVVGSVVIM